MRSIAVAALVFVLLAVIGGPVEARESKRTSYRIQQPWSRDEFASDIEALPDDLFPPLFTSTAVDTYTIVYYDFDIMDWQGWTRVDLTAPEDTFWHVEDYLEPELAGMPGPLEGLKSAWIGAPPGPYEYVCDWVDAPGYGNSWDESLVTDPIYFSGLLRFSYRGYFDSEPDYDKTRIEYDAGGGNWVAIAEYDGIIDTSAVHELFLSRAATKIRIHFKSDGAWSDEDGLWDTDGGAHVDELTIEDSGGLIDYEDFETASDGAHESGIWHAEPKESFTTYSRLWINLEDDDPCNTNFSTQIAFFEGAPGSGVTPYCKGAGGNEGPCQDEMVVSPVFDITRYTTGRDENQDAGIPPGDLPGLGGAILGFTIYRDLPHTNLVGYNWAVRTVENGCPGSWQNRGSIYIGTSKDYHFETYEIGDLIDGDSIQVGFWVADMCEVWYEVYGTCEEHTASPYIDNVYVKRYSQLGPQWFWRDLDIFQDNFPEEEYDLESYVRADAANDLRPNDDPVITPGDSAVVSCESPLGGGIDTTPDGWPQVFMHCYVHYIGDPLVPKPDLYGPDLAGNYGRYHSDDGEWTILQCDYARTGSCCISPGKYMVDMNDSLITRGYQVYFYFKAYDMDGRSSTLPPLAPMVPWPPYPGKWHWDLHWMVNPYFFEWTALPTLASDVLYVDDFHGRGTYSGIPELYWMPTFRSVLSEGKPDVYDVNSPSSRVSDGPGSRAKNFQMTTAYRSVVWDSGNLSTCTISEGTEYSDKSNDAQMLVDWMEFSPHMVGLWICGDDVAADLAAAPSGIALTLLTAYCGVQFVGDSYYYLSGIVSPLVRTSEDHDNPFWYSSWGDSFYVFGGCPVVNGFDYLEKTGNGAYAFYYPDVGGLPYYAGIYSMGTNDGGYPIRTIWFGFSFMYMRDVEPAWIPVRNMVGRNAMVWMYNGVNDPFDVEDLPVVNSLAQNYPNPFNPTTMINFSVKEKGRVTLRIYDVAGRLVRTLVDEMREAGHYRVEWNGANNRGVDVASGVYFYRIVAGDFVRTRKMLMLR